MTGKDVLDLLFYTQAVSVCPENKPFWYTSGTIGPYYINTHYLYGGEEKANELLKTIDGCKDDKFKCPAVVSGLAKENYLKDPVYTIVINKMLELIRDNVDLSRVDYISGGERRDWFFSLIASELLDKPHLTIYKDLSAVVFYKGKAGEANRLEGSKVLHIADLITEASSFERAWIPAVNNIGGRMLWSAAVVDRRQGGEELLKKYGVELLTMVSIDEAFFKKAFGKGLISKGQLEMLLKYTKNPVMAMKEFLQQNPKFMEESLNADEKTRERARLCIEKGVYF
jgi:orotate phosphoribosyltransferase